MLKIYNPIGTFFVCGFQLSNKKSLYIYLFEILLVDPLTLTIILSLFNPYINITSQSSFQLLLCHYVFLLFVVYIINLLLVRPWSCQVIYYFDTPILERRHQLFGRVKFLNLTRKLR
jgi:hypothetical protein